MKPILFFCTFCALVLFIACNNSGSADKGTANDLEEARKEVMKIHDDSMAEIGKLRALSFLLDSLSHHREDSLMIKNVVEKLNTADEEMMQWMSEYKEPQESEKRAEYFNAEKEKISVVAELIYSSIAEANKIINE